MSPGLRMKNGTEKRVLGSWENTGVVDLPININTFRLFHSLTLLSFNSKTQPNFSVRGNCHPVWWEVFLNCRALGQARICKCIRCSDYRSGDFPTIRDLKFKVQRIWGGSYPVVFRKDPSALLQTKCFNTFLKPLPGDIGSSSSTIGLQIHKIEGTQSNQRGSSGDPIKPFAKAYLPFPVSFLFVAPLLLVGGWFSHRGIDDGPFALMICGNVMMIAGWTFLLISLYGFLF